MSFSVFITLTVIAVIIEIIFTPLFLKAQRPGKCNKSLCYKMICATMFFLIGIMVFVYSGNTSPYAKTMLVGLTFSWVGDLLLHVRVKWGFYVGFVSFLTAHVFYTVAYCRAAAAYFPEKPFFTLIELGIVILVEIGTFLIYTKGKHMSFKRWLLIPMAVYGFVLSSMMVKATSLGVSLFLLDSSNIWAAVCLIIGGTFFWMSDISMVPLTFVEADKRNHRLKDFNITTYFSAQTLLALTILFVGN